MLTSKKLKGQAFLLVVVSLILGSVFPIQTELKASGLKQDLKSILFNEVDQVRMEAKNAKADILTPQSFNEAVSYYDKAQSQYKERKSLEDIKKTFGHR